MASYTTNLNLLKKDPVADGSDTFNIQTMLNDNWDKIDAAMTAAKSAEEYNTAGTYAVGSYCIHEGKLYKCTTAITTAEAWTAGHWTETSVGAEIAGKENALAAAGVKATPADADSVPVVDSADSNKTKRVLWSSIKSAIQTALENIFAKTTTLTATVPVSWTASGGFYYQQVSVPGMLATDNPVADILPGSDNAANKLYADAWAKVQSIDTLDGAVKLWCTAAPTTAFPLQFLIVR